MAERDLPFSVELTFEQGTSVVHLSGEVDISVADRVLEVGHAAIEAPAARGVVVDLGRLRFIDSLGLNSLVRIRQAALAAGKTFTLRNVPDATRRLLTLAGLDLLLPPD